VNRRATIRLYGSICLVLLAFAASLVARRPELAAVGAAYAAVVVELDVDEEVKLRRVWCVADAGLVINPDGARNQLEGGIVHAASITLKEQVTLGAAGVTSLDWDSYPILRFSEVPEITTELIAAPEHPSLGMGECTFGPTAAAIGNAVAHGLGTRIRAMPLTRERIMAALLPG
jgi:CO/xanthine dehydrogenase Mo-binding subunit